MPKVGQEHDILYSEPLEYTADHSRPRYQNDMGAPTTFDLPKRSARDTQVAGNHYTKLAIQPGEYALANGLNYWQGNVIKYVTRYRDKNGAEDLDKAIHCLQMLKAAEYPDKIGS